ncbi:MAG TPA: hypothetical protein VGS41_10810, partial [Chthonomonadales bacterium]|nr:hypothetical protein [Chthonomonadales bacterium]
MKFLCCLFLPFVLCGGAASALPPPSSLSSTDLASLAAPHVTLTGAFAGALVSRQSSAAIDEKLSEPFHVEMDVYSADETIRGSKPQSYTLRFRVHGPDAAALQLVQQTAQLLFYLHGETLRRFGIEHPESSPSLSVWLSERAPPGATSDVGGEQFRDQIYLYRIMEQRQPLEWMREIAHEYGHFAIPGVSGYSSPEEWANGVLGQRLYLKWLRADLRAGLIRPDQIPFATPTLLDEYAARQITPLIDRICRNGVDTHALLQKSAAGMDYLTGLAMYVDSVYGSKALFDAFSYSSPLSG